MRMADALKIMAWDDSRCTAPIAAASSAWFARTGVEIEIAARSLAAFNDQPLRELSPKCDLMVVDYPHVAKALEERAIVSFDKLADPAAIRPIAEAAIGNAQASFLIGGKCAALACDAACHLSAFRPDQFARLGREAPTTMSGVFALMESNPGTVAAALHHTDALSVLMSLAHGAGIAPDGGRRFFRDAAKASACAAALARFASKAPEYCWNSTPQEIFRIASAGAEIAYIPFTFGYSRMVEAGKGGWRFAPPPAGSGSLLGGAGMAVSSHSRRQTAAAEFALWYCGCEGQALAARNFGQPSRASAWDDPGASAESADFFNSARTTQEIAFVRPLASWWPAAQLELGAALVEELRRKSDPERIILALESVYGRHWTEAEA